jgi:thymidylate synthase
VDGLKEQLKREPRELPTLHIADKPVDELSYEDFTLENYNPHPHIKFEVAV